jgi:hypothetical protein
LHRVSRALALVRQQRNRIRRPLGESVDDRNADAGQVYGQRPINPPACRDDPVHTAVEQRVEMVPTEAGVILDGAEKGRHASIEKAIRDAGHNG